MSDEVASDPVAKDKIICFVSRTHPLAKWKRISPESLVTAAICAHEIRAILRTEFDSARKGLVVATEAAMRIRPGATQGSAFSVRCVPYYERFRPVRICM